jgi:hypothetical protein
MFFRDLWEQTSSATAAKYMIHPVIMKPNINGMTKIMINLDLFLCAFREANLRVTTEYALICEMVTRKKKEV